MPNWTSAIRGLFCLKGTESDRPRRGQSVEQPENFSSDVGHSFPDPEKNAEGKSEVVEKKWTGYGAKEERSFYLVTGGSVFLHVSFIFLMLFDSSFREIVESYLGVRSPVPAGEKIYVSILDPSQIHLGRETLSPMLQKGYSINGEPNEQGHQNVLSNPTNSPPTEHATVPPRAAQVLRNSATPPLSRAILMRQDQKSPSPKRTSQLPLEVENRASKNPNGSPSPGGLPHIQAKVLFQKSQRPSDNRILRRTSVQRKRSRHVPNDEFPTQVNSPHTTNPSLRHLSDRVASVVRPLILPKKQVLTSKRNSSKVANEGSLERSRTLALNARQAPRNESVPKPRIAKEVRPPSLTSRTSVTPEKRKTVPQIRTVTRMNRTLEQASLGNMQDRISLQGDVNPVYATRSNESGGTAVNEADVIYSKYIKEIDKKFEEIGKFPHFSANRNVTGENRITFTILKDGTMSDLRIIQSSDHSSLDEESLRIVQDAAPFQPIPDQLKKKVLTLTWTFHYSGGRTVSVNR